MPLETATQKPAAVPQKTLFPRNIPWYNAARFHEFYRLLCELYDDNTQDFKDVYEKITKIMCISCYGADNYANDSSQ